MPGRVSSRSSDSVSSNVVADESSNASVFGDASYSVSRRNSDASEYFDAASIASGSDAASSRSGSDVGSLSDLEAYEPSKVAKLFSFVFPKISCFKQAYADAKSRNTDLIKDIVAKAAETERWNDQIEATIDQLRKQPEMPAPPLNFQAEGSPGLHVSVPADSSAVAHGGEEAAGLPPKGPDFEAIKGPFNETSFPRFQAEITSVCDTLDNPDLSVDEKVSTLITLKKKTDIFSRTVKMMNLAEALRDTARSGADYKVADRTAEIESEKATENEAISIAEQALAVCQREYDEQNGLLQDLLGLQEPVDGESLRALYERYLEISEDDVNTTSFEAFTNALFDENNQYLNSLNDLVAASRQKVIDAHKELDDVKALQHSEIEYDFFRRSPQSGLGNWFQTNTFVDTFTTFNGSWDFEQIGNFFNSIRSSLLDADQNKFMRVLVITALIAAVILYPIAKITQTTVALGLALGATTVAMFAHAIFQIGHFFVGKVKSRTYDAIQRNRNVPKDEEQANKTRIADPNRKLVIAAHFATNPRNLAVERVASSSLEALVPRRKGVKQLRPLISKQKVTNLRPNLNAAALLGLSSLPVQFSMLGRSDSLGAHPASYSIQRSHSQVLESSSAPLANVPQTPMLMNSRGEFEDDRASALCWKDIHTAIAFREVETKAPRQRRNLNQSNSLETGSAKISHSIPKTTAFSNASVVNFGSQSKYKSVSQTRQLFALSAQPQTIESLEQEIYSQESISDLIKGMTNVEIKESYANIVSQAGGAVAPSPSVLSWRAIGHNISTKWFG